MTYRATLTRRPSPCVEPRWLRAACWLVDAAPPSSSAAGEAIDDGDLYRRALRNRFVKSTLLLPIAAVVALCMAHPYAAVFFSQSPKDSFPPPLVRLFWEPETDVVHLLGARATTSVAAATISLRPAPSGWTSSAIPEFDIYVSGKRMARAALDVQRQWQLYNVVLAASVG